ncbi:MAG: MFS transporter, partial [Cyclobacteriaceae bacterium]
ILLVRQTMGVEQFEAWGWRIPFLLSAFLVAISIYIRLRMQESPLFHKIKSEGKLAKNPIRESFTKKKNLRLVLIALFGAAAGQGVVWYTGQFYALTFIQKTLSIEFVQSYYIIGTALVIGTPLFIFFGWWSDKIGRKYIMLAGMLLSVLSYRPIYRTMYDLADVTQKQEIPGEKTLSRTTSILAEGDTLVTLKTSRAFQDGT